jgi:hypothetical protein
VDALRPRRIFRTLVIVIVVVRHGDPFSLWWPSI